MKRLVLALGLGIAAYAVGCTYTKTYFQAVKAIGVDLANGTCYVPQGIEDPSQMVRAYDWPCGAVSTAVCRDNSRNRPLYGEGAGAMHWALPDLMDGHCVQAGTCEWAGLDPEGSGDLRACIRRWRRETCARVGKREGKKGRVVDCSASQVDVYIVGEGWDLSDYVDD